jgi:hypothetical protein
MLTIVCGLLCILKLALEIVHWLMMNNKNISLSNLHRTYIGMIERAEKNVTLINIEKIANGLEISIHELMMFNELAREDNRIL